MGKQVLWTMFLALLSWREAMERRHLQATAAMFNLGTDLVRWGVSPKPFPKGTLEGRRLKKRLVQLPTILDFG